MPNFKIDIKTTGEEKLKKIIQNIDDVSNGFEEVSQNINKYSESLSKSISNTIEATKTTIALKNAKLQQKVAEEALLRSRLEEVKSNKLKQQIEEKLAKNGLEQIKINNELIKSNLKLEQQELKRSQILSNNQQLKTRQNIEELKSISNFQKEYEKLNNTLKNSSIKSEGFKDSISGAKEYEKQIKKIINSYESFSSALAKIAIPLAAIYALNRGLQETYNMFKKLNEVSADFEKISLILENIEGSSKKGRESLDWIKDFATNVPQSLKEVSEAFVKLKSYGINPTNGLLKTLADTSLAMGKDLNQGVEAVADAVVGENERLKEFGITASRMASETLYTWTDNAGKAKSIIVSNNRDIIESTLQAIFNEKYAGQTAKFMTSYEGINSILQDNITKFKDNLAVQSGIFASTKNFMAQLSNTIEQFQKSSNFDEVSKKLGIFFDMFVTGLFSISRGVIETGAFLTKFFNGAQVLADGLSYSMNSVVNGFKVFYYDLKLLYGLITDDTYLVTESQDKLNEVWKEQKDLLDKLKKNSSENKKDINNAEQAKQLGLDIVNNLEQQYELSKKNRDIKLNGLKEEVKEISNLIKVSEQLKNIQTATLPKNFQTPFSGISNDIDIIDSKIAAFSKNTELSVSSLKAGLSEVNQSLKIDSTGFGIEQSGAEAKAQANRKKTLISYYKEIKEYQKSFDLELIQLKEEALNLNGLKEDEWKKLEKIKKENFNKEMLDLEFDLKQKSLQNDIDYYKAKKDYDTYAEKELENFKIELKKRNIEESSKEFKQLVISKEEEIKEEIIEIKKTEADKIREISNKKLEDEMAYYKAIKDIKKVNELELKKIENSFFDSSLSEKQKQEIINAERINIETKQRIQDYDKEIEKSKLLGNEKNTFYLEQAKLADELNQKQYEGAEIAKILSDNETEFLETYREAINEKMSMTEAFQTQMNNMSLDLQNKIQTTGQQAADFAKTISESMESNFTNFFDATSDKFLSFKDLVKGTITDILKQMAVLIAKQLAARATMAAMGGFGFGGPSFFANGGVFSGGQQVTAFADGGAFTNSVVDKPVLSPMALFGEAGPEAIMPLSRDSNGRLGVQMNGGMNQQQVVVSSNIIINNNSSNVKVSKSEDSKGNKVLTIEDIDAQLSSKIRNGDSKMMDIMQNKYPSLQRR